MKHRVFDFREATRQRVDPAPSAVAPVRRAGDREVWRAQRLRMEANKVKSTPDRVRSRRHWIEFRESIALFGFLLRVFGLYKRGVRNALDIRFNELELRFGDLPRDFDGFRILQVTDPHIDMLPNPMDRALELIESVDCDLCVLTGDYRRRVSGPYQQILPAMEDLVARVSPRHGIFAILGNHDCADMAEAFEGLGIQVLINETRTIRQGGSEIALTGTDDVHYYYTDAASAALRDSPDGFKIALVHSPELADVAADNGFDLYLAGHTHGGQVCLPGGMPIITHMTRLRQYASGLWRRGAMTGYTSMGLGTSALPVRFNTRGEVTLFTLRRG